MNCGLANYSLSMAQSDGIPRPCCSYDKKHTVDNVPGEPWILNNETCAWCIYKESKGIKSLRMGSREDYVEGQLEELEVSLDFTCNMTCRSCSPRLSSKWGPLGKKLAHRFKGYNKKPNPEYSDKFDAVMKDLDFTHLKEAKFVGGEPLYSKKFEGFYNRVKHSEAIVIHTNGSVKIPVFVDKSNCTIRFSIDAIGDLASCIRPGVDWEVIDETIRDAVTRGYHVELYPTISILNVNKLGDIIDYADELEIEMVRFGVLQGPEYLRSSLIPLDIRKYWNVFYGSKSNSVFEEETFKEEKALRDFLDFTDLFDELVDHKFKDLNPEIYNICLDLKRSDKYT